MWQPIQRKRRGRRKRNVTRLMDSIRFLNDLTEPTRVDGSAQLIRF